MKFAKSVFFAEILSLPFGENITAGLVGVFSTQNALQSYLGSDSECRGAYESVRHA
jgi:hypothetical protein